MAAETSERALSRDVIVETAVRLMTDRGLTAVTLRRIATELGVSAPTLYWYIANKQELLDRVAEFILLRGRAGVFDGPAPGQPWWQWLEERSRAMFQTMISVRDAPQVLAGNRPTLDTLADADTALGELVAAGFGANEAQQAFFAIGAYVGGMALEWQSEAERQRDGVDDSSIHRAVSDSARFAHLAAATRDKAHRSPMATFDYGLALLIRGLRCRHAELTGIEPVLVSDR